MVKIILLNNEQTLSENALNHIFDSYPFMFFISCITFWTKYHRNDQTIKKPELVTIILCFNLTTVHMKQGYINAFQHERQMTCEINFFQRKVQMGRSVASRKRRTPYQTSRSNIPMEGLSLRCHRTEVQWMHGMQMLRMVADTIRTTSFHLHM